jgi:uncharacterized protein (TIGR02246 family)
MKLHKIAAVLAAAATMVTLTACKPAGPSTAEMDAIKAVNGAWAEHYNAGDAGAVADLYWENASLMAPGAPASAGRDAIREYLVADIASAKAAGLSMNIEHGPVNVSGNTAWQEGVFRITDASGATVDAGKYLSVLEKRDGTWRLLRDIYNSDGAVPTAAPGPDAVTADPAHYKVEFENDKVRVLRISYGPKEKSVMHSHPNGVVVFMNDLQGRFTMPDGTTQDMQTKAGTVSWTDATIHSPENLGDTPFQVIQVELK